MIHRSKLIQKHCLFKKILFIEHDLQTFLSSGKGNALLWPASGLGLIELAAGWKKYLFNFFRQAWKEKSKSLASVSELFLESCRK